MMTTYVRFRKAYDSGLGTWWRLRPDLGERKAEMFWDPDTWSTIAPTKAGQGEICNIMVGPQWPDSKLGLKRTFFEEDEVPAEVWAAIAHRKLTEGE